MTLRRGFEIKPGERALVVEDVVTTGGSTREVMEVVRSLGGVVAGAGSLIDRSGGDATTQFGVSCRALLSVSAHTYYSEECPMCKEGIPIVKPGTRGK